MSTLCQAPSIELHFNPDGTVRPCCLHARPYGTVGTDRLAEIWNGARRRSLIDQLTAGSFPAGCEGCAAEVAIEGRIGSYPELFDQRVRIAAPTSGDAAGTATVPDWPTWIEFNLSNRCNLQCVQCDGELSSAIRAHRERRAPLVSPYDDRFFQDLVPFLPHLVTAQFAGGEPFLAEHNYRVWGLIAEHAPHVTCVVITNATQFTPRVERAMRSVRMGFTLSIDGISRATFEAIRVGAEFDAVMANCDRFIAHSKAEGTPISVNHCLMPQNVSEFSALVAWADSKEVDLQVSVVRGPAHCSLARLPRAELAAVIEDLERQHEATGRHLGRNRGVWDREIARIRAWFETEPEAADARWASSRYAAVLGFDGQGSGATDDREARDELGRWGGEVFALTVRSDDRIHGVSAAVPRLLGRPESDLLGSHIESASELLAAVLGPMQRYEVTGERADRRDASATFERGKVRLTMLPIRDGRGMASEGRLLFAVRPLGAER